MRDFDSNEVAEIAQQYYNLRIGLTYLETGRMPDELNPFQVVSDATAAMNFFQNLKDASGCRDLDLEFALEMGNLEKRMAKQEVKIKHHLLGKTH